ncbi:hypothetical protein SKAU_G00202570 [Synaphobranchus kaupii]|uniref:Uncharacterized protein n=1 Tax=Synaphobranchus kaupii TaxID=118154 RepID=A0A9Q1FG95_SYNKA|nr:hypothetical protein SKAU_G00202570 [Synaphobranchus kaupii]
MASSVSPLLEDHVGLLPDPRELIVTFTQRFRKGGLSSLSSEPQCLVSAVQHGSIAAQEFSAELEKRSLLSQRTDAGEPGENVVSLLRRKVLRARYDGPFCLQQNFSRIFTASVWNKQTLENMWRRIAEGCLYL